MQFRYFFWIWNYLIALIFKVCNLWNFWGILFTSSMERSPSTPKLDLQEMIPYFTRNNLPLSWIAESDIEILQIRLSRTPQPHMMIFYFTFQSSFLEKFIRFMIFQPFQSKETIHWVCNLALIFFWHSESRLDEIIFVRIQLNSFPFKRPQVIAFDDSFIQFSQVISMDIQSPFDDKRRRKILEFSLWKLHSNW